MGHALWGTRGSRRFFGDSHWEEPLTWNEEAAGTRQRQRVFCASMADVFEDRSDLDASREKLWTLILATPWLDWLLLTKRPQNIERMTAWGQDWPDNIWLGTTVENQKEAERRLPHLLRHDSSIRFLSCEPLLGPLDLTSWLRGSEELNAIDWVIAGGESGHRARPMHPDWPMALLRQCQKTKVAFHFKQWGHWAPEHVFDEAEGRAETINIRGERPIKMIAAGKKAAGRLLSGSTWNGVPKLAIA